MTVGDGDIVQGVVGLTMVNGDEAKNVFTFLIDKISIGNWTDSEIGTFVLDAIELIFTEQLSTISSGTSFDTVDVYKRVLGDWDYLTTKVMDLAPSGAGDALPAGVAMLMTAYTDLNKVFGRKFVYGVTEANIEAGTLTSAALGFLADAAAQYLVSYSGGTMGVLDFLIPGVWSSKAVGFIPFNGIAVVKDVLSYQRRRKKGVGV